MVKPKTRRKELEVPKWVRDHWEAGNRDEMADLLKAENFSKAHSP